jgi:lipopolysaccharide/colanic/teichoic acid biosynthesis glycosyltransferase
MADPIVQMPNCGLHEVQSLPVGEQVIFSPCWNSPVRLAYKRVMDIIGSAILLTLLMPLMAVLAILVKATSRGPVFYHWRVVGKNGKPFLGYKFRSMVANAEQLKATLAERNEMSGPMFKLTRDPRLTPLGAWMRRYSLDELPQFYSVLRGDMSLVGPRPPLVTEYAEFNEFQKQKLVVKPGITCLWQVSGRNRIRNFDEWVRLDLQYIRTWSLTLDFVILMKTIREVFLGSGK